MLFGHVLLVDDSLVNCEIVSRMLHRFGVDYTVVHNGADAVTAIQHQSFDFVFMDCQMPDLDGFQATQLIRDYEQNENKCRTPIIALTAETAPDIIAHCQVVGMDGYLQKPIRLTTLQQALTTWLTQTRVSGHSPPPFIMPETATTKAPANSQAEILDITVLERIRELRRPNQSDPLLTIIQLYLEQATQLMHTLEQALNQACPTEACRAAHTLKSSSANLGSRQFTQTCRQLEEQTREDHLQQAYTLWPQAQTEFNDFVHCLQTIVEHPH
jgi:CheY-like chemotaxis protein/HPt (histidine-containing phosphotransfer) domain-containing protein